MPARPGACSSASPTSATTPRSRSGPRSASGARRRRASSRRWRRPGPTSSSSAGAARPARVAAAGVLDHHRRGRPRGAVRHRGHQAARARHGGVHPRPGSRRPERRAGHLPRHRPGPRIRGAAGRAPRRAARRRRGGDRARAGRPRGPRRSARPAGVDVRDLVVEAPTVRGAILAEAANHQLVVVGAAAQPTGAGSGRRLFGRLAETVARPRQGHGHGRPHPAAGHPAHLRGPPGRRGQPAGRRRGDRGRPEPAERRRSLVRREHVPRRGVPRPAPPGRAQGARRA